MPAVLLGQNNLIEESKTEEPPKVDHSTHKAAFLVLIDKDNNYIFEPDINKPVIPERKVNQQEAKAALAVLLMNVQIEETALLAANATVGLQQQMARSIFEQQQNAQVLQQIGQKK